ncbi:sugar ABC transporter permease [Paenibacillus oenotherae]|uniref:Sugar ABC transporter permease n=1 Tax=Paenibacillus oenotherae TaxID=1435645 RepID=A0ABS7D4T2_9BACL|nr:sugar ABC transporter permease [Paenibacillus oenotherae]MBW7474808.1 sugar ABC transporter permease [Paenibacillus oenotherae]
MQYSLAENNEPKGNGQVKGKRKTKFVTAKTMPYLLLAPTLILFSIFYVYPIIYSVLLSFQTRVRGEYVFAGLKNYSRMIQDPIFYKALGNSMIILVIQVPLMLTLAVLMAVALNSSFLKLKGLFRIGFFSPVLTSLVAASVIFMLLLNKDYGLLNYVLTSIGLKPIGWLSDGYWPLVTLIIVTTWRWAGYNMVILLAGLQNISNDLYEAASIDGASKVKQFFYITLPQLKPVLLVTFIMSTIGSFQLFDEPYTLTGGGPNNRTLTLTLYLYQHGFTYFDFGYASAITYAVVLIVAILSIVQFKLAGDKD